ncbi:transcription factor with AP2 domain(s), putative [Plasmodium relictum]|uniref:Transcription factor with AP2 domain(S), putative n=1 Tax=Plasmodium relictum TaxID=85471 RepID=A0A1J1HBF9_PLARL|nr:transcription factor with AP2 domain(s), putative [Plasmodium relictum]CRH02422.1 transcription factor with AP2 domain(s), putative [Plasmodium relictum]
MKVKKIYSKIKGNRKYKSKKNIDASFQLNNEDNIILNNDTKCFNNNFNEIKESKIKKKRLGIEDLESTISHENYYNDNINKIKNYENKVTEEKNNHEDISNDYKIDNFSDELLKKRKGLINRKMSNCIFNENMNSQDKVNEEKLTENKLLNYKNFSYNNSLNNLKNIGNEEIQKLNENKNGNLIDDLLNKSKMYNENSIENLNSEGNALHNSNISNNNGISNNNFYHYISLLYNKNIPNQVNINNSFVNNNTDYLCNFSNISVQEESSLNEVSKNEIQEINSLDCILDKKDEKNYMKQKKNLKENYFVLNNLPYCMNNKKSSNNCTLANYIKNSSDHFLDSNNDNYNYELDANNTYINNSNVNLNKHYMNTVNNNNYDVMNTNSTLSLDTTFLNNYDDDNKNNSLYNNRSELYNMDNNFDKTENIYMENNDSLNNTDILNTFNYNNFINVGSNHSNNSNNNFKNALNLNDSDNSINCSNYNLVEKKKKIFNKFSEKNNIFMDSNMCNSANNSSNGSYSNVLLEINRNATRNKKVDRNNVHKKDIILNDGNNTSENMNNLNDNMKNIYNPSNAHLNLNTHPKLLEEKYSTNKPNEDVSFNNINGNNRNFNCIENSNYNNDLNNYNIDSKYNINDAFDVNMYNSVSVNNSKDKLNKNNSNIHNINMKDLNVNINLDNYSNDLVNNSLINHSKEYLSNSVMDKIDNQKVLFNINNNQINNISNPLDINQENYNFSKNNISNSASHMYNLNNGDINESRNMANYNVKNLAREPIFLFVNLNNQSNNSINNSKNYSNVNLNGGYINNMNFFGNTEKPNSENDYDYMNQTNNNNYNNEWLHGLKNYPSEENIEYPVNTNNNFNIGNCSMNNINLNRKSMIPTFNNAYDNFLSFKNYENTMENHVNNLNMLVLPKIKGVRFDKSGRRWVASWSQNGNQKRQYFPVKKFGQAQAKYLAIYARIKAVKYMQRKSHRSGENRRNHSKKLLMKDKSKTDNLDDDNYFSNKNGDYIEKDADEENSQNYNYSNTNKNEISYKDSYNESIRKNYSRCMNELNNEMKFENVSLNKHEEVEKYLENNGQIYQHGQSNAKDKNQHDIEKQLSASKENKGPISMQTIHDVKSELFHLKEQTHAEFEKRERFFEQSEQIDTQTEDLNIKGNKTGSITPQKIKNSDQVKYKEEKNVRIVKNEIEEEDAQDMEMKEVYENDEENKVKREKKIIIFKEEENQIDMKNLDVKNKMDLEHEFEIKKEEEEESEDEQRQDEEQDQEYEIKKEQEEYEEQKQECEIKKEQEEYEDQEQECEIKKEQEEEYEEQEQECEIKKEQEDFDEREQKYEVKKEQEEEYEGQEQEQQYEVKKENYEQQRKEEMLLKNINTIGRNEKLIININDKNEINDLKEILQEKKNLDEDLMNQILILEKIKKKMIKILIDSQEQKSIQLIETNDEMVNKKDEINKLKLNEKIMLLRQLKEYNSGSYVINEKEDIDLIYNERNLKNTDDILEDNKENADENDICKVEIQKMKECSNIIQEINEDYKVIKEGINEELNLKKKRENSRDKNEIILRVKENEKDEIFEVNKQQNNLYTNYKVENLYLNSMPDKSRDNDFGNYSNNSLYYSNTNSNKTNVDSDNSNFNDSPNGEENDFKNKMNLIKFMRSNSDVSLNYKNKEYSKNEYVGEYRNITGVKKQKSMQNIGNYEKYHHLDNNIFKNILNNNNNCENNDKNSHNSSELIKEMYDDPNFSNFDENLLNFSFNCNNKSNIHKDNSNVKGILNELKQDNFKNNDENIEINMNPNNSFNTMKGLHNKYIGNSDNEDIINSDTYINGHLDDNNEKKLHSYIREYSKNKIKENINNLKKKNNYDKNNEENKSIIINNMNIMKNDLNTKFSITNKKFENDIYTSNENKGNNDDNVLNLKKKNSGNSYNDYNNKHINEQKYNNTSTNVKCFDKDNIIGEKDNIGLYHINMNNEIKQNSYLNLEMKNEKKIPQNKELMFFKTYGNTNKNIDEVLLNSNNKRKISSLSSSCSNNDVNKSKYNDTSMSYKNVKGLPKKEPKNCNKTLNFDNNSGSNIPNFKFLSNYIRSNSNNFMFYNFNKNYENSHNSVNYDTNINDDRNFNKNNVINGVVNSNENSCLNNKIKKNTHNNNINDINCNTNNIIDDNINDINSDKNNMKCPINSINDNSNNMNSYINNIGSNSVKNLSKCNKSMKYNLNHINNQESNFNKNVEYILENSGQKNKYINAPFLFSSDYYNSFNMKNNFCDSNYNKSKNNATSSNNDNIINTNRNNASIKSTVNNIPGGIPFTNSNYYTKQNMKDKNGNESRDILKMDKLNSGKNVSMIDLTDTTNNLNYYDFMNTKNSNDYLNIKNNKFSLSNKYPINNNIENFNTDISNNIMHNHMTNENKTKTNYNLCNDYFNIDHRNNLNSNYNSNSVNNIYSYIYM